MKNLLNTWYVLTDDIYLSLDGENVVASVKGEEKGRIPLHNLQDIVSFAYPGASPQLMSKCCDMGIGISFFTPSGRFLCSVQNEYRGNVFLRKQQYRFSDDEEQSVCIARNMIIAKISNQRNVLERCKRDHALVVNLESLQSASDFLKSSVESMKVCPDTRKTIMGIEGDAASIYFNVFDEMILQQKDVFQFSTRSKRPPMDPVNALLSLFYTILTNNCADALRGVGLDPFVGFLHADRAGRVSLACDLVEELRGPIVERFVLTLINKRIVSEQDFVVRETGEYLLAESGRKKCFEKWQENKKEMIVHPYTGEKIQKGMIPHLQAMLLARYIRGDLDGYPPYFWR